MIIWLASYPKSGNTLLRSIISSYFYTNDGNFTFDLLKYTKQFPSKFYFQKLGIDIDNEIEMQKNYIEAQKLINSYNPLNFIKTHSSYKLEYHYNFTDHKNTLGMIYIVRDPRNVILSFSNHYEMSLEQSLKEMLSSSFTVGQKFKTDTPCFVGPWNNHYNSWKTEESKDKYLLIRYEDLINEKRKTIIKILEFISKLSQSKLVLDEKKLKNLLKTTDFFYLQNLEEKGNFNESMKEIKTGKKIKFFDKGPENQWKILLEDNFKNKIEASFKKEMLELGYL